MLLLQLKVQKYTTLSGKVHVFKIYCLIKSNDCNTLQRIGTVESLLLCNPAISSIGTF